MSRNGNKKGNGSDGGEEEYEVGYKKPPIRNRFKPGDSGNLLGRPKKKKTLDIHEALLKGLMEKRTVIIDGQKKTMKQGEIIARAQIEKALKGDTKSADMIFKISEKHMVHIKEKCDCPPPVVIIDDIWRPDD